MARVARGGTPQHRALLQCFLRPTISTPYLDASGAGIVITISRAVTRGGPTDPVAGVVGVDVTLAEVKRLVNQQSGCASSSSEGILS